MMRVALLLSSALLSSAAPCVLDSSGAVSNAIDSALYIWAATKRCAAPVVGDAPIKCEQDVASSVKAVTATASAIAGMMNSCGAVDDANAKCGLAVNGLISATAGLAAAGGKLTQYCMNKDLQDPAPDLNTVLGKCTIQSGGAINSIFDAKNTVGSLQKQCDDSGSKKCAVSVLDVVGVVSDLGAHLAGSAAYCQKEFSPTANVAGELCANGVLEAIADLSNVARIAMGVEKACSTASTRLYLEGNVEAATSGPSTTIMAGLVALGVAGLVLGVAAGSRIARSQQTAAE
jgi:hypothetical protein